MTHYATLLLATTLLAASCSSKKTETASSATADTTATAVDLTKRPDESHPRSAADRLVRALYFEHDKTENPFLKSGDNELAGQYFTPDVAAQIQKNATAQRPKINPLFGAPDADVAKRWVWPALVEGEKAVVFVTYQRGGKEQEMRCELQQQANNRWRVADIVYADGKRLTSALK